MMSSQPLCSKKVYFCFCATRNVCLLNLQGKVYSLATRSEDLGLEATNVKKGSWQDIRRKKSVPLPVYEAHSIVQRLPKATCQGRGIRSAQTNS